MPKTKSMSGKESPSLIEDLRSVLLSNTVGTQEEIKLALEEMGHEINQSKISRLLRRLGAIKTTNERRQIVYTLPLEPAPPASKSILSELITSIHKNESIIVIHTNPGSASLIGRLLDHHRDQLMILGTVAGDDTIFIAPLSVKNITKTRKLIQSFLAQTT